MGQGCSRPAPGPTSHHSAFLSVLLGNARAPGSGVRMLGGCFNPQTPVRSAGRWPLTGPWPHGAPHRGHAALLRAQEAETRLLEAVKIPQGQRPVPRSAEHPARPCTPGAPRPAELQPRPAPPLPADVSAFARGVQKCACAGPGAEAKLLPLIYSAPCPWRTELRLCGVETGWFGFSFSFPPKSL